MVGGSGSWLWFEDRGAERTKRTTKKQREKKIKGNKKQRTKENKRKEDEKQRKIDGSRDTDK